MRLRKTFTNNSSGNIKLSKNQLHKVAQSGGFLSRLLGPLLKTDLPIMENVLKPLVKSFLIPWRLTGVAVVADAANQIEIFWIGYDKMSIFKWKLEWFHENR